jgi:pyridoxine kinase
MTGYFARPEQVTVAARALDVVRVANPAARLIVDPIMGDEGRGLYVSEPVAEALAAELVPAADIVAPNAWELQRLSGHAVGGPDSALAAARALGRAVLVSSVVEDTATGAVYAGPDGAWFAEHPFEEHAPKGTGDLLTAVFAAALVEGRAASEALEIAVGAVADAVAAAHGLDELPLAALPTQLAPSTRVSLRRLDG